METTKKTVTEIWLFGDEELKGLCELTGVDEVSLIRKTLQILVDKEATEDGIADAGLTLEEVFKNSGVNVFDIIDALPVWKTGPTWFKAARLMQGLVIKSTLEDCPECGFETEATEDGAYGKTWLNRSCNNCDWEENNEPDFPDHKDYYNR